MDLNKKIIEAIRQEPALYGNDHSLEERNRLWKKLSGKLNIPEQMLKIRWHSLVQRYQSENDFKYSQQMQFMKRKPVTNIQEGNWPEFHITEEDLQDHQQNGDEFEFVELDELDNVTKQIKDESDKEKDNQYDNKRTANQDKQIRIVQNVRIPNISQEKTDVQMETTNTNSSNESSTKKIERPLESKITDRKEESNEGGRQKASIIVESSRENEYEKQVPKREEPKKIEPPPSRCEDDIFGELVSAMLKRMDETKKKNVKKEIMNLLLT